MVATTLSRYFGLRFLGAVVAVFAGIFALVALVDFIELLRRSSGAENASAVLVAQASLFRVPQITERILPFTILIGAMACYLSLSRRLELVIARAAGISAWQFVAPALIVALGIGVLATTVYNPVAAVLQERSKRIEMEMFGSSSAGGQSVLQASAAGFWVRQKSSDGQAIINARTSSDQGIRLGGVIIFTFDDQGHFKERIEANTALLERGFWRLSDARVYAINVPPRDFAQYSVSTTLSAAQVRESFATPETVPFWELPTYIDISENSGFAASGYRLQYQKLLARPLFFVAMVMLAASVSLRFFRFGGVQKMVLSGVGAGFLLYVLSKVTDDLSRAELMYPAAAAWLPVVIGGLTGLVALLYQEDG
jgi:lipopolysaccharide export system permease protein